MKAFFSLMGSTRARIRRPFHNRVTGLLLLQIPLPIYISLFLVACNASANINKEASRPKTEAKVILPAQHVPTPENVLYVYDNESIFTAPEEQKLDSLIRLFERSNLIPIKVVTVKDPTITAENFDAANKSLLDQWSAAHGKSDKCMAISISRQLRRIRIDYGAFVLRLLSDQEAKAIIENEFKPSFKQDQFYQGTSSGLTALMNTIRNNIKF